MTDKPGKGKKKSGAQRRREKAAEVAAAPVARVLRRETMQLTCKLTADEQITRGVSLASVLGEIKNEPARAEALKAQLKSDAAALEKRRDELAVMVSRGEEVRDVIVEDRLDEAMSKVRRIRTDTEAVIAERDLTAEERQVPMPLSIVPFPTAEKPADEPAAETAAEPAGDEGDDGGGESPEPEDE